RNYGERARATLVEAGNLADREYECGDRDAGIALVASTISAWEELDDGAGEGHAQVRRYRLARMQVDAERFDDAMQSLQGLEPKLLTSSDSTPGWEHRLAATRGEILIRRGQVHEGRAMLAPAAQALEDLGVADAEDSRLWHGLLGRG